MFKQVNVQQTSPVFDTLSSFTVILIKIEFQDHMHGYSICNELIDGCDGYGSINNM